MGTSTRRQRAIARTRDDIVEAAARAFARSGYDRATMQQIAQEAGYTAASLYTYFRSKEQIFDHLIEVRSAEHRRAFDEPLPEGKSFEERLEATTHRQLELHDRHRELFLVLWGSMLGETSCQSMAKRLHAKLEERVRLQAEWFRKNGTPEDLGGRDPELAARYLVGFSFSLVHDWDMRDHKLSLAERAHTLVELFLYGIRGDTKVKEKGNA